MSSFTEKLDDEGLAFFNELAYKPFAVQAQAFLNAYWNEVEDQAEFIFSVSYQVIRYADMHTKGVSLVHLYDEGNDVDFNIGLYFYEKLQKKVEEESNGKWLTEEWAPSRPQMMTAIVRKKELREKVDCNFDGRVSFLEYLLYQYREFANPADFVHRSMEALKDDEHPEIKKARLALEEVRKAIRAYEAEKKRLEDKSKLPGVKGLTGVHELSQLGASPQWERLNCAIIHAEAAVRIAIRKYGNGRVCVGSGSAGPDGESSPGSAPANWNQGTLWWMNRELEQMKKHYGRADLAEKYSGSSSAAIRSGATSARKTSRAGPPAPAVNATA